MTYHLGPEIRTNDAYYRDDLRAAIAYLDAFLHGEAAGVMVLGLARSGKTSFLRRIARLAGGAPETTLAGEAVRAPGPFRVEFMDLRDWGARAAPAETPGDHLARELEKSGDLLLILDELDATLDAGEWPAERGLAFVRAIRAHRYRLRVVVAAAPIIEDADPGWPWRGLLEEWLQHVVGPLSDEEAAALVEQRRSPRPWFTPLIVDTVLEKAGRLPLPLQALAHATRNGSRPLLPYDYAGTVFRRLSLAQREALRAAASWPGPASPRQNVALRGLEELGAVRRGVGAVLKLDPFLAAWLRAQGLDVLPMPAPAEQWTTRASILHLSDLHFDPKNLAAFRGLEPRTLLGSLTQTIGSFDGLENRPRFPDVVVVSGDLSWGAHPAEFDLAVQFLEGLADWLAARWEVDGAEARERFVIVPGNHDSSWDLCDGFLDEAGRVKPGYEPWLPFALAPFADAYARFHQGRRWFDAQRPYAVHDYPDLDLCILALSSCHQLHRRQRDACLDPEAVAALAASGLEQRAFRLATFHHNVEQVRRIDDRNRYENDFLHNGNERLPLLSLHACLHGHTHLTVPGEPAKCGVVCFGAGSFGVNARHLPGNPHLGRVPRQFNTVVLQSAADGRRRALLWTRQCVPGTDGSYRWEPGTHQGKVVALNEASAPGARA